MKRTASVTRRIATFFLAVLFVWAAGPDAYGLHPCPEHSSLAAAGHGHAGHSTSALSGAEGSDASEAPSGSEAPVTASQSSGQHSGGTCSCIESCVVAGSVAAPSADVFVSSKQFPDVRTRAAEVRSDAAQLTPRHAPFELHLPNAPPRSL